MQKISVSNESEFLKTLHSNTACEIVIENSITVTNAVDLPANFSISGKNKNTSFLIFNTNDGIGLTDNNRISNITIMTNPIARAIKLASVSNDFGKHSLENVNTIGMIQFLNKGNTSKGLIEVKNVHVKAADSRNYSEQPLKYGVSVYQGAFTVYNMNNDDKSNIEVNISGLRIGFEGSPVIGSGVFLAGFGDVGGKVTSSYMQINQIYSTGMIAYGQPNKITGGVFISNGAEVKELVNSGDVVTYGVNDMVLDTWGKVEKWIIEANVISYGPSGIGFVNFGTVNYFEAKGIVETFGAGARGFNQYDGTVDKVIFKKIITHGDGAIGIQISKPVGEILINESIITKGSVGKTLVKGVIENLSADALSIKPGGHISNLLVKGNIETWGNNVTSFSLNDGSIDQIDIDGKIIASGDHSFGAYYNESQLPDGANFTIEAPYGNLNS